MSDYTVVMDFLTRYGMYFLFLIVFLEYLNLPGLPSGIIMPAIGLMISQTGGSLIWALFISVVAGLLGSYVLYAIGYFVGGPAVDFVYRKFSSTQKAIDSIKKYTDKYGNRGVFITRLIPVARTLVSLVAGITRMKIVPFSIYSTGGIILWNLAYILAGYWFGAAIFGI